MKITLARADKISSVFNFWDACQLNYSLFVNKH